MVHESDIRAMPEISQPSQQTRTTLFKLQARQCRFIVSDDQSRAIFCGSETQEGSSWCPWHRRLVYARPSTAEVSAGKRPA
ncbi:GcrA family cell cycle regulator [Microvirga terrae]|uniref:GcrA family cell cycle regulator n=1 Tax=Microvirga terrae TaxID=2740529 RepID=UPI003D81B9EB